MIKKASLIGLALVFAFGILGTSLLKASWKIVRSSYPVIVRDIQIGQETEFDGRASDYFKGYQKQALPGDYFYPFGIVGDQISLLFTTDKSQKADRLISLANKRMGLGLILLDQERLDEAWEAMYKAERFLWLSWEQGKAEASLKDRYKEVLSIHEESLLLLRQRITDKSSIDRLLEQNKAIREQL